MPLLKTILRTVFKKSESKIFNLLIIKGFIVFAQKYKTLHKQLVTKTVRSVVKRTTLFCNKTAPQFIPPNNQKSRLSG